MNIETQLRLFGGCDAVVNKPRKGKQLNFFKVVDTAAVKDIFDDSKVEDDQEAKKLKALSCITGRPVKELVSEAVTMYIRLKTSAPTGDSITSSRDVFRRYSHFAMLEKETFHAVSLNAGNRVTGDWRIAEGSLHQCAVSPRDIFSLLMREGAFQVIFIHNHPSGNSTPSKEDIEFTKRLVAAGSILGIKVLDHIIIGGEGFTSLADEGHLISLRA